jgi:hypothetical protein
MNVSIRIVGAVLAMSGLFVPALVAAAETQQATSATEALIGGKLLLNLRPRYEFVDQDGKPEDAKAFTVRSLIGWETKPWHSFSLTAQAINVSRIGSKDYNDQAAQAAASRFPLVADPNESDINQLFVDYTGLPKTRIRAGRQAIKIDNVRFIGNVEFRQVMQVFGGVLVENKSLPNTEFLLGHMERVKSINATERKAQVEILHAAYRWSPNDSVIGYAYLQDDPKLAGAAANVNDLSNRILGIRFDGAHPFSEKFALLYTAEYAKQDDYADGDAKIDADYYHVGIGPRWGDWYLRLDQERLASNDGQYAFQTPLGTNHLFQGWADQFLTTPRQGLRDTFLMAGGKLGKVQLLAEYHRLKSDVGGIDFGDEVDFSAAYPFMKQLLGKVEYADYQAGDAAGGKRDTTKIWLTLIYNY